MQLEDLFVDKNIPDPLPTEELYTYYEKIKLGDTTARNKIIYHNIRLVLDIVIKHFSKTPYRTNELVSIGLIGLIKSVDTFDISKGLEFSTYASKCIKNEIWRFMQVNKKYISNISMEEPIEIDEYGNEIKLEDFLSADINIEEEYNDRESYRVIREVVDQLPEKDKIIIKKYFGFSGDHTMTQQEIADELGVTKSCISLIIANTLKRVSEQLKDLGIIEVVYKGQKYKKRKNHISKVKL